VQNVVDNYVRLFTAVLRYPQLLTDVVKKIKHEF